MSPPFGRILAIVPYMPRSFRVTARAPSLGRRCRHHHDRAPGAPAAQPASRRPASAEPSGGVLSAGDRAGGPDEAQARPGSLAAQVAARGYSPVAHTRGDGLVSGHHLAMVWVVDSTNEKKARSHRLPAPGRPQTGASSSPRGPGSGARTWFRISPPTVPAGGEAGRLWISPLTRGLQRSTIERDTDGRH